MNNRVNFEIAQLLKEKGFEGTKSPLWYYKDGTLHETSTVGYEGLKCWNTWDATQGVRWDAPTIAEVVMWLYENHGIWITADAGINGFYGHYKVNPIGTLTFYLKQGWINFEGNPFKTPLEAYSEAILYTLKNLI